MTPLMSYFEKNSQILLLAMSSADTPNVWLTLEYPDMASMAQTKAKNDKVDAELEKLYGDNEVELEEISRYEEIRTIDAIE